MPSSDRHYVFLEGKLSTHEIDSRVQEWETPRCIGAAHSRRR